MLWLLALIVVATNCEMFRLRYYDYPTPTDDGDDDPCNDGPLGDFHAQFVVRAGDRMLSCPWAEGATCREKLSGIQSPPIDVLRKGHYRNFHPECVGWEFTDEGDDFEIKYYKSPHPRDSEWPGEPETIVWGTPKKSGVFTCCYKLERFP